MSADAWPERKKRTYELPLETIGRLADYCHWEGKKRGDVISEALIDFLHVKEKARGEPYPVSPKRKEDTGEEQ